MTLRAGWVNWPRFCRVVLGVPGHELLQLRLLRNCHGEAASVYGNRFYHLDSSCL